MTIIKKYIFLLLIFCLSFFSIHALFVSGFFPIHDDAQVQRVYEMTKSLQGGMFPVRWVSDLGYGYGYPLFNFYAPLAYYIGAFFMVIGFNALASTKIMIGCGIVLAGISMYYLMREVWDEKAGFVAAIFYIFAPYHALDVYVRGDIAEMWAYAFIPLLFLGIILCFKKRNLQGVIIGSLSYAGVIVSHNLTAMMVTPFILLIMIFLSYFAYRRKEYFILKHFAMLFILGLLISSFYWLPVFTEMKYTNVLSQVGGGADYRDHFVCFQQLWNSPWGYGGSTRGCADGLSFRIGKLHVIFSFAALLMLFFLRKKKEKAFLIIVPCFILYLLSVFLLLPLAEPIWNSIHTMAFFQYPWRFLLMISFFSSVLSGVCISMLLNLTKRREVQYGVLGIVVLLTLVLYAKLFIPQVYLQKTAEDYTNERYLEWNTSKISDEYMPRNFSKPKTVNDIVGKKVIVLRGNPLFHMYSQTSTVISAKLTTQTSAYILIKTAYFPSWRFSSGMTSRITNTGYVLTIPPSDNFNLSLSYRETPIEVSANILSLCGIILLILAIISLQSNERARTKTS